MYKQFKISSNSGGFGFLVPVLIMAAFFGVLFLLVYGFYKLLYSISIVLIIATVILDYKVVVDFVKYLLNKLKDNPLNGLITLALAVVGFPFVFGYLFVKALNRFLIKRLHANIEKKQKTFDQYEDVTDDDDFTNFQEMPTIEKIDVIKPNSSREENKYNDIF